ncbi:unnamed protein product [Boreogadus saida]
MSAVAALESEVGNPNAAVFGCMIEFRSDEPDITRVVKVGGPDSFNQLFACPLPERYALWQGRFSLQSVRCKEKAEFLVVRSSVALSHRPAMQWYSPLSEEPDITLDVKVGGARQL